MTDGRLHLRAGAHTDIGRARSVNQDRHLVLPERGLWVVADGMGGAQGGEVAASMVVDVLVETYQERSVRALLDSLAEANRRIHEAAADPDLHGMGTTAVALAVVPAATVPEGSGTIDLRDEDDEPDRDGGDDGPEQLVVVNVGDSRAYLYRDGDLVQLTEDHSLVGELVRDGRLTREEAHVHPQRNIVTRVLGPYESIPVDVWPVDARRGDRIVLCSDGLSGEVTENQISAVLRRLDDPEEAAEELVRLANESGGRDNITVIVVDVLDDGEVAEAASASLAGQPSRLDSEPDLAGFSTALVDDEPAAPTERPTSRRERRAERRAARRAERRTRTRITWRVLAFLVLLAAVFGGAVATIQWYGTNAWFVGFEGDEVAIFQGRPGGLLWIEPKLELETGIMRDEVPATYVAALEAGHEHASLAQAERFVSNIERDIAERREREARDAERATTTTTTTTRPTTTTTAGAGG